MEKRGKTKIEEIWGKTLDFWAWKLVRQNRTSSWEFEDFRQELILSLLVSEKKTNIAPKNSKAFFRKVLENKYKDLQRKLILEQKHVSQTNQEVVEEPKIPEPDQMQKIPIEDKIFLKKVLSRGTASVAQEYRLSLRHVQRRIQNIKKKWLIFY